MATNKKNTKQVKEKGIKKQEIVIPKGIEDANEGGQRKRELTPKELKFCNEYIVDLNGSKAAIRCGYSAKTSREIAYKLLTKVHIQEKIAKIQLELRLKTNISAEKVINELAKVGFSNIQNFVSNSNEIVRINSLDTDVTAALSAIKVTVNKNGDTTTSVRLHDKVNALTSLGKHLGVFERDNTQKTVIVEVNMTDEQAMAITKQILDKI